MRPNTHAPRHNGNGKVRGHGFWSFVFNFRYHSCSSSLCFLVTGGVSCVVSLLSSSRPGAPSLTMSLVVGVANEVVAGGNEGVMEDEEEGGGEVFKADKGESGRWLLGIHL